MIFIANFGVYIKKDIRLFSYKKKIVNLLLFLGFFSEFLLLMNLIISIKKMERYVWLANQL